MGTVAEDRRETKTKKQEKDVSLPASQSPRPSYSRPCLTDQQACGEGALPHLHPACLQRAHWSGNQPRLWSGTRLWTWPRSCLWPGLCQWCPCGPNQTRPCVHWISSLYSGSSHWPPCWPSGWPPCRPSGWPPRGPPGWAPCWAPGWAQCWPVHRATSTTLLEGSTISSLPTLLPSTSTLATLVLDSRLQTPLTEQIIVSDNIMFGNIHLLEKQ